jgi:hypothetical protein
MRPRHLALVLALSVGAWLLPGTAHADLKLATLNVKGLVCQA